MSLAQKIYERVGRFPESIQAEILDFVDFIDLRKGHPSGPEWNGFSLSSAMRGMENELLPEYTAGDLKEKFQ